MKKHQFIDMLKKMPQPPNRTSSHNIRNIISGLRSLINTVNPNTHRQGEKTNPAYSNPNPGAIKFTAEKKLNTGLEMEMALIGEIFWPKTGMRAEEKKELVKDLIQIILREKITTFKQLEETIIMMIREAEIKASSGNEEAYKQAIALQQFLKNIKKLDYYQRQRLEKRMESLEIIRRKYL
jgi:hypothetical protein